MEESVRKQGKQYWENTYFIAVENTGASWMTAGQCFRSVCPKYLCILASCFQLAFLLKIWLWDCVHCSSSPGSTGWGQRIIGVRLVLPVDFPVAKETDYVNRALFQSLQPPGHVSKLHWSLHPQELDRSV